MGFVNELPCRSDHIQGYTTYMSDSVAWLVINGSSGSENSTKVCLLRPELLSVSDTSDIVHSIECRHVGWIVVLNDILRSPIKGPCQCLLAVNTICFHIEKKAKRKRLRASLWYFLQTSKLWHVRHFCCSPTLYCIRTGQVTQILLLPWWAVIMQYVAGWINYLVSLLGVESQLHYFWHETILTYNLLHKGFAIVCGIIDWQSKPLSCLSIAFYLFTNK